MRDAQNTRVDPPCPILPDGFASNTTLAQPRLPLLTVDHWRWLLMIKSVWLRAAQGLQVLVVSAILVPDTMREHEFDIEILCGVTPRLRVP
jgi:hypothetical protein